IHKVPLTKRRVDLVENVDLDLLSLFPQKGARIIGGKESKQAQRGQQWGEELAQNRGRQRRKKTPFYSLPRIQPLEPVGSPPTTVLPLCERYYRGAVLPQPERGGIVPCPTTALSRRYTVVGAVLATVLTWRGTTVAAAVLPPRGSTTAQYRAHYRPIQRRYGSGCGTSHGTTVARYYRNGSGTTAPR